MKIINDLVVISVPVCDLKFCEYNPRKWSNEARKGLTESLDEFGFIQPLVVNSAPERKGVVIGGNFKLDIAQKKGVESLPVVWVNIPDLAQEKALNLRLNKNQGEFNLELLADFDESLLKSVGFSSEDLDKIFELDENPEAFDLTKELAKLNITSVDIKPGDTFMVGDSLKVRCGDSTIEADMLALADGEKVDMVLTDPPYILDYLKGKKKSGKATEGFGLKRDRKYLGTDVLPENFSDLWMANVAKVQKPDFSILVYENPKNLRTIWTAMEQHWRYRNTIVWHVPNRVQGFSAKYKFHNKFDIALVSTSGKVALNVEPEEELLQNEYEAAIYATSGKPHWESYEKGKKYCPSDHIDHVSADGKQSGQNIIFGTKPLEVLIPYLKVLTKRGDLVLEPFGGSGSTAAAAWKLKRRCFLMEKSPVYTAVILKRLEKLTGLTARKV